MHLIINAGSTTIKYVFFEGQKKMLSVRYEKQGSKYSVTLGARSDQSVSKRIYENSLKHLFSSTGIAPKHITRVVSRVVHGGNIFQQPVQASSAVLKKLNTLDVLAPLHNPPQRLLVQSALKMLPKIPHWILFDTAFHHTLPERSWRYALPKKLCDQNALRRFGFHGIVCSSVVQQLKEMKKLPPRLIICHLGSGCSVTAVKDGKSVDTSMGFTPLEGLIMGTRAGDLDPGLLLHLEQQLGLSSHQLSEMLLHESGLKGLTGSADMRVVEHGLRKGHEEEALAFELFCFKAAKVIASYCVPLGGIDMIVFSGGIGENAPLVRAGISEFLRPLGVRIHPRKNAHALPGQFFHQIFSKIKLLWLHADEEAEMNRWLRGADSNR